MRGGGGGGQVFVEVEPRLRGIPAAVGGAAYDTLPLVGACG
jgi:hypothetical protein